MKTLVITLISILLLGFVSNAQTTRYFEFSTSCGHGNWQDTAFLAATSDQAVIDTVLANIARPIDQRKFINGKIDNGNGGYNRNASHSYLWHFIPSQWELVDFAVEVCDGCPYTDLDSDTAYWIGNLGYFCPWSGRPVREVSVPTDLKERFLENEILLYPNPAKDKVLLSISGSTHSSVILYNSLGQEISNMEVPSQKETLDLSKLPDGLYTLKVVSGKKLGIKKLIVNKE